MGERRQFKNWANQMYEELNKKIKLKIRQAKDK